jgi:leader peptidase (prepilin peptidase) / N-methyltransferase
MAATVLDASLIVLLGVVTLSDLRARLIPDAGLVASLAIALPLCVFSDPAGMPERLVSSVAAASFLLVAALIRPEGMGLGDVKLAGVLGLYLGSRVIEAMLIAFAAGSLAGMVLLARHGLSARSRTIPFAPFLAIGAVVTLAPQP